MWKHWIVLGIFLFSLPLFAENCQLLEQAYKTDNRKLAELTVLSAELEEKFDTHVKADFTSQSEGVFDQIHRNAAMKVLFAKKKLQKKINEQTIKMKITRKDWCEKCQSSDSEIACSE